MNKLLYLLLGLGMLVVAGCGNRAVLDGGGLSYANQPINVTNRQNIWLAEWNAWLENSPSAAEREEFERQAALLREFAMMLNTGGKDLSDLRVVRVQEIPNRGLGVLDERTGQPMQVSFHLMFADTKDMADDGLIAEMLAYTGIEEDNISVSALWSGGTVTFGDGYRCYLLVNEAVYEIAAPYLRLRKFAMKFNEGTVSVYDDCIVEVRDAALTPWASSGSRRFSVLTSTRELANCEDFINSITEYTGIDRLDMYVFRNADHTEYLRSDAARVNAGMGAWAEQWERLHLLFDAAQIRTARRGIVMDSVLTSAGPPHLSYTISPSVRNDAQWWNSVTKFSLGISQQRFLDDGELLAAILEFTGMCADDVEFKLGGRMYAGWMTSRRDLTEEQIRWLDVMEEYMETVNAPFWADRRNVDPVIVRIGPPQWRWCENAMDMVIGDTFTVWVYDGDYGKIRDDILRLTGMDEGFAEFKIAEN